MRKRLGLLTMLLAIPFVNGCSFLNIFKPSDNPGGDVVDDPVDVESISLSSTSLNLNVNEIRTILATVLPDDASDKTITWKSSDINIATVTSGGTITAVSPGDTVITAKTSNDKTATCSVHVNEINVNVLSISLDQTELTLNVGDEATILATINPDDASNKTLTWTSNNSSVATVNNGVVTALSPGDAVITAKTSNGKTATCSVHVNEVIQLDWSETEKAIFNSHLYEIKLPFVDGLTATYDNKQDCVVVEKESMTQTDFDAYIASIVALGFTKENGQEQNTYTLLKELTYGGKLRTIEIDIFLQDGALCAVCYDPYEYEFVEGFIPYVFKTFYFKAPKAQVPDVPGDRYIYDTNKLEYQSLLIIYAENQTNCEASYSQALTTNGFTISDQKNENGFFAAVDPEKIVEINFAYDTSLKVFVFIMKPYSSGWPIGAVNFYLSKILSQESTTVLPQLEGAEKYEFIEASWDAHGYFFILCEGKNNLELQYKEALLEADYTVYDDSVNTAGNYFAISSNQDLLVQYKYIVVESIMGGDPYIHTDVLFEPYYPHDETYFNEKLQLVSPGTKTTIPTYPGYGEDIKMSDNNVHMFVEIQSSYLASVNTYIDTLNNAGWNVKAINTPTYQYEAISPNRDVRIETSFNEGRINLDITSYKDEYKDWPTEGVNEILSTLELTGEVPALEGAYGFDYENNDFRHDIVCFVKTNTEQEIITAYNQKLEGLGWSMVEDGDYVYYVKGGGTVALRAYTEYAGQGIVFIDITMGDDQIYDIDARNAFIYWKVAQEIKAPVQLPGLNLAPEIENIQLAGDEGETYPGYTLFELLVSIDSESIPDAINEIAAQFVSNGWVKNNNDGYYYNNDLFVNIHEDLGYLAIDICASLKETIITYMKNFFYELGYVSVDELPEEIDLGSEPTLTLIEYNVDYINMIMALEFEDEAKLTTGLYAINSAFIAKGWTLKSSSSTSFTYLDESGFIKLILTIDENNTLVVQTKDGMYF